jgi:hypothetical protein
MPLLGLQDDFVEKLDICSGVSPSARAQVPLRVPWSDSSAGSVP